eukprot:3353663-Ditylum_brightwellii.AAC.1
MSNVDLSSEALATHHMLEDPLYLFKTLFLNDKQLISVYRNMVHLKDSTHGDVGIEDDADWQDYWKDLMELPCQRYNITSGKVGHFFIELFATQMDGEVKQKWNSERFMVFPMIIL